jgi:hypothetical protein
MVRVSPAVAVTGLPGLTTVALAVPEPSLTRAAKPMPTTRVARTSATATTFRWVRRLAASSEKLFHDTLPKDVGDKKRAAGVVRLRRLVLAPSGLTGLLNPCVKSGTKLFQPYCINCFNCVSPALPPRQPSPWTVVSVQPRVTNRTDYSGSEDRMAPAAATGASPRARPCFAPRSKASNTSPQGRRNR